MSERKLRLCVARYGYVVETDDGARYFQSISEASEALIGVARAEAEKERDEARAQRDEAILRLGDAGVRAEEYEKQRDDALARVRELEAEVDGLRQALWTLEMDRDRDVMARDEAQARAEAAEARARELEAELDDYHDMNARQRDSIAGYQEQVATAEAALALEKAKVRHLRGSLGAAVGADMVGFEYALTHPQPAGLYHQRQWSKWEAEFAAKFQQAAPEPPAEAPRDPEALRDAALQMGMPGAEQYDPIAEELSDEPERVTLHVRSIQPGKPHVVPVENEVLPDEAPSSDVQRFQASLHWMREEVGQQIHEAVLDAGRDEVRAIARKVVAEALERLRDGHIKGVALSANLGLEAAMLREGAEGGTDRG